MPLVDLLGAIVSLALDVVEWAVRRWPAAAAGYVALTLFGVSERKRLGRLPFMAWPFVGFVAGWFAYRRSRVIRRAVRAVALAGWLYVLRVVDPPGRAAWVAATLAAATAHLVSVYGWRAVLRGQPITVRSYVQARQTRSRAKATKRGVSEVQDERASLSRFAFDDETGMYVADGHAAPGKSPRNLVDDGNNLTLGNAINQHGKLYGLEGVNVHVEIAPGADGGFRLYQWEPGRHPLDRDLPWPGPHAAGPDDPVPLGVALRGGVYSLPAPGVGGMFWLVGGTTGSGKTTTINVAIAELASRNRARRVVDIDICDPLRVDYAYTWGRAFPVAEGREETVATIRGVKADMDHRYRWLRAHGRRVISPGEQHRAADCSACAEHGFDDVDWTRRILVVDEIAVLMLGSKALADEMTDLLLELTSAARKAAIGTILATQSPKAAVIKQLIKENCRVRVCFATEEPEQTEAVLGIQKIPAHSALTLPGESFGKQDKKYTRWRGWYATDAQLEAQAAAAAATMEVAA